jgi:IPT/TIG domain
MRRVGLIGSVAATVLSLLGTGIAPASSAGLRLAAVPAVSPLVSSGPPSVLGVAPDEGTNVGGTKVTIGGERLTGVTTVDFGATPVALKQPSKSATTIKVVAPAGTGTVDVTVTGPEGTSATTPADRFTYTPSPPVISKLSPDHGAAAGGIAFSISGVNFSGATAVRFGAMSVPFTVKSAKTIKTTVPTAHALGSIDVTVTTPEGTSAPSPYTYEAELPAVEELPSTWGPAVGGNTVPVLGKGFLGASRVTFDGNEAISFETISDTEISAVAPPGTVSKVAVQVTTPEGTSPASCPGRNCKPVPHYEYREPAVTAVEPSSGPLAGGTPLTITGAGFSTVAGEMAFQVGHIYMTGVSCSSIATCTAMTAAGKVAGAQSVIARVKTNKPEQSEPNPAAVFTYE